MSVKKEVLVRLYLVFGCFALFALAIIWKAFQIAVIEGDQWRSQGESLYVQYKEVEAERGNILADDGSLLASSLPYFEIRMDLRAGGLTDEVFQKGIDSLAYCLSRHIDSGKSTAQWKSLLVNQRKSGNRYLLIAKSIPLRELNRLKKFPVFRHGQHKGGLIVKMHGKRERPFKMLAHRTVGLYRENAPSIGLEKTYNKVLEGEKGKQLMQRINPDIWIPVHDLSDVKPKQGKDIVTTLNVTMQDIAHRALESALQQNNAAFGTAIVMEVATGQIKAIVNLGKSSTGYWEDYNYAIGMSAEPGSTFKLAAIMALLEDGMINLEDTVELNHGGPRSFYGLTMKDAKPHRFKKATIRESFEISSNVGMALIADKYYSPGKGGTKFIERLRQFGLHELTGIELEGEGSPYIKNAYDEKQFWSKTTIPWMSTGYECQLTPLQILNLYNTVANDGKMMKPYLVKEIRSIGESVKEFKPTVLKNNIASPATIEQVRSLLAGVVENGTARHYKTDKYSFAGKTGTAVIDYATPGRSGRKKYQASFAGYFPAESPKYSCIVVINDPAGGVFYGSQVAVPVFREIADHIYHTDLDFHPTINETTLPPELAMNEWPTSGAGYTKELERVFDFYGLRIRKESDGQWAYVNHREDELALAVHHFDEQQVPDVRGMGLRDAMYVLENSGLQVKVNGTGKVRSQSVQPGGKLAGQTIFIELN
jgi:cell division protein FtsI (penicillin-binding protein 3)